MVKIINQTNKLKFFSVDLNSFLKHLINLLDENDIRQLAYIKIVYDSPEPKYKDALGLYYSKSNNRKSHIVLCLNNIKKEIDTTPWVLRRSVFTPKYHIAKVFYHEIGHHLQYIGHGYKKGKQEKNAEKFGKQFLHKWFSQTRLGGFLKPFRKILLFLLSSIRKLIK